MNVCIYTYVYTYIHTLSRNAVERPYLNTYKVIVSSYVGMARPIAELLQIFYKI